MKPVLDSESKDINVSNCLETAVGKSTGKHHRAILKL